jgi:hypothetical protein
MYVQYAARLAMIYPALLFSTMLEESTVRINVKENQLPIPL